MRGCGTVFNDEPADFEAEEEVRENLQRLANRLRWRADQLDIAITHCRNKNSNTGLTEMVAFTFNAQQYTPSFGGGGEQLPPGKGYKVVAVEAGKDDAASGQGGFVFVKVAVVDGPLSGKTQMLRFNLHHTSAKTVEIANEQFSALCHVVGQYQIQDLDQLLNRPFLIDVDWQKGNEPGGPKGGETGGYTEVKALYDLNGNKPGKGGGANANAQPQQQQQAFTPPPAQVQAQGGWVDPNGGQPQQQPQQGYQQPQQGYQQQPQGQPQQQGWAGAPAGQIDNNVPMPNQGQPQQQQPQGQGWGGNAGQPPAQGGGWAGT